MGIFHFQSALGAIPWGMKKTVQVLFPWVLGSQEMLRYVMHLLSLINILVSSSMGEIPCSIRSLFHNITSAEIFQPWMFSADTQCIHENSVRRCVLGAAVNLGQRHTSSLVYCRIFKPPNREHQALDHKLIYFSDLIFCVILHVHVFDRGQQSWEVDFMQVETGAAFETLVTGGYDK
jgi:hypothetical protein